ncbi:MAG: PEP/pyruvate-binding domain-containing protein [Polyangia bacterium]|jgi:pyruvate,water dikinase
MAFLTTLDASDASLGGKARSLARLDAAGLATPAAFVVTDTLFRAICPSASELAAPEQTELVSLASLDRRREEIERAAWPAGFVAELRSRLACLAANRFSVRSSFAGEDTAGALAAGVYASRVGVGANEVEAAIRDVLSSAFSPGAAAYARAHGQSPGEGPRSVLIHVFMRGRAEGSSAFAPGAMAEPTVMLRRGYLPADARVDLQNSVRKLTQTMGALEVEWVLERRGLVYLQARPFAPPPAPIDWPGWHDLPEGQERGLWRWDAAHNPLPLSPAQSGLVKLVDERCLIGIRQRVLGGYLCYAPDHRPLPAGIEPTAAAEYFAAAQSDFESRRAGLAPGPQIDEALELFAMVYERILGVLRPALQRSRAALASFLERRAPGQLALLPALTADVASIARERRERAEAIFQAASDEERMAARAAYLARFGDEAPVWDLCCPTYEEEPAQLELAGRSSAWPPSRTTSPALPATSGVQVGMDLPAQPASRTAAWRAASAAVEYQLAETERATWRRALTDARTAAALAEADDWLYAKAQAVVRKALLATGQRLRSSGDLASADDIFFLPLDLARQLEHGPPQTVDLRQAAAAGRAAWQAAQREPPPPEPGAMAWEGAVRGYGTGGRAVGRIWRHQGGPGQSGYPGWPGQPVPSGRAETPGCPPPSGYAPMTERSIVLARTLLPTELPLIAAAGLVTETGGPLDHVAAQARERGIPAVIGAAGALTVFCAGDLVLVDGDRGLVVRLDRG